MAHSLQGVYSPLPQSLSDSDSEKEISMEPICPNYGNGLKKTKPENSSYRQNGSLGFSAINDEIVKIKRVNPKMSTLRKVAFVLSILLCFLPIIIFLWILPCSDSNTCPVKISNWESEQDNIELQGHINLVHGAFQTNLNLALMYRGSLNTPEIKTRKNGVISFVGNKGAVAWNFNQESYPIEMNCSIIDVDNNGYNDCLLIDETGLKAIHTIKGEAVWHAHTDQEKFIPELDMPVKVKDFDNDGVNELLAIYKRESFILISGKTGLALSNIKISHICTTITNLTTNQKAIRYACKNPQKLVKIYEIELVDIQRRYKSSYENLVPREVHVSLEEIVYETGNRKLTIENYDHCPHCRSIVSLYHSNNTKLKVWPYQNAYVMNPVPFFFQSTKDNIVSLRGYVHGFVLKIWEWKAFSRKLPTTHIYKRSIPALNKTYYLNDISERVILITFNETDIQIINASLTDIYQICNGPGYESSCQPEYRDQQNSLLIADIDHDNSQELISYSNSYVKRDEDGNDKWHLVSHLRVFRLEKELPKLYDSK